MHKHTCDTHMCIYTYIYRERDLSLYIYICTHDIYIYIYRERERERQIHVDMYLDIVHLDHLVGRDRVIVPGQLLWAVQNYNNINMV